MDDKQRNWFEENPKKAMFLIVSLFLIVLLSGAEALLRMTAFNGLLYRGNPQPQGLYRADPDLGYDLTRGFHGVHRFADSEYKVFTNSLGCFDREVNISNLGDYILLLGDSFTWGYASFEKKWGTILEKKVNVRVIKCGVAGYGLKQEIIKGQRVVSELKTPPKLILVGYYQNDLNDDYFKPDTVINGYTISRIKNINYTTGEVIYFSKDEMESRYDRYKKYGSPDVKRTDLLRRFAYYLKKHSVIANILINYIQSLRYRGLQSVPTSSKNRYEVYISMMDETKYPWVKSVWDYETKEFQQLKVWADHIGASLGVVIIPTKEQVYAFLDGPYSNIGSINKIKSLLRKLNIPYYDLYEIMRKHADMTPRKMLDPDNDYYWAINGHWSEKGNIFVGNMVASFVKKLLERR